MNKMFKNRRGLMIAGNVIYSFILIALFVVIYILTDGGTFQNFIQDLNAKLGEFTLISAYLIIATTQVTNMSVNQLIVDVEDERKYEYKYKINPLTKEKEIEVDANGKFIKISVPNKIQALKDKNIEINDDPAMQPTLVYEFVKLKNDKDFKQMQDEANLNKIRKLEERLIRKQNRMSLDKFEARLSIFDTKNKIGDKYKKLNVFKKVRLAYLNFRLEIAKRTTLLDKRLKKYKSGELKARVRGFKPITRNSFYSASLLRKNGSNRPKLKTNIKTSILLKSFGKAVFINTIYGAGLTALMQSLFDYDWAKNWQTLLIIVLFFMFSLFAKYIFVYIINRPKYKDEIEEVLTNINTLAKECLNYCLGVKNEKVIETSVNP